MSRNTILAEGRRKGQAANATKAQRRRQQVEAILDHMEVTGQALNNEQIAERAGVGKNYLGTSHPDLGERVKAIRARIVEDHLAETLAQSSEVEHSLASENDQLHHRISQLEQLAEDLQGELLSARNEALSEQHSRLDPRTGELLQEHNQGLIGELNEARSEARKYKMAHDTVRAEKTKLKGDLSAQRSLLGQATAELKRLHDLLEKHGIDPAGSVQ